MATSRMHSTNVTTMGFLKGLFKGVVGWLLLGAGIGAFIYGFVPTELLEGLAGADNLCSGRTRERRAEAPRTPRT